MNKRDYTLSDAQVTALVAADEAKHGGVKLGLGTARVLARRGLIRSADKPGAERLGVAHGCWYATRAGINYLAVHAVRYTWGTVRKVHRVGDTYAIVEADARKADNVCEEEWTPHLTFHPYHLEADGTWTDPSHSYHSLDEALIACVVWRHVSRRHGIRAAMNERATGYIMQMIEADHEEGR